MERRLVHFGISDGASSGQNRAMAVGDIDGDNLTDVVITDPENAQVLVFRQNGIDGLGAAEVFPGLLGATDACTVDVDRDGRAEVVLMSEIENVVALSRFENGRLTFPKPVTKGAGRQVAQRNSGVARGRDAGSHGMYSGKGTRQNKTSADLPDDTHCRRHCSSIQIESPKWMMTASPAIVA